MSYAKGVPTSTIADLELASALRISIMRLSRRLRAERSDETVSISQLAALGAIDRHGPMSPTALAEHERVQPPSMTRIICALEGRGHVRREPHPHDRRQSVIAITDGGRRFVAEERRRRDAWLAKQFQELTAEERQVLRSAAPILEGLSQL